MRCGAEGNSSNDVESSGDYRDSHAVPSAGAAYNKTYEVGYYAALWNKIERPLLEEILRQFGGPGRKCLDFACGTGRITDVAAQYFGEVVGVDVSAAMLACVTAAANVRVLQVDITHDSLGETFDVITAFRFFLNAGQRLREEALDSMRDHLKETGRLVCNVHMNAASPFGVAARIVNHLPFSRVRNTMRAGEMTALLHSAGFSVERVIGYGYLPRPGHLLPHFCERCVEPAEQIAKAIRMPARFAQQLLFVAKKR
jgi:SAM-dependent methyltransferase